MVNWIMLSLSALSLGLTAFVAFMHASVRASMAEQEIRMVKRISEEMADVLDRFNGRYVYSVLFHSKMEDVTRRIDSIEKRMDATS